MKLDERYWCPPGKHDFAAEPGEVTTLGQHPPRVIYCKLCGLIRAIRTERGALQVDA
jgi:hypothetical protein